MRSFFRRISTDLLNLIAPALCPSCNAPLAEHEGSYCNACKVSLEVAPFPNAIYSELISRAGLDNLALSAIGSLYTFTQDSPVQRLIHGLKYRGCRQLGVEMGVELGKTLGMFNEFNGIEYVVPVPLHRARLRERGYNQSEAIADGLISVLPNSQKLLGMVRTRHTPSQTTLAADDRLNNVRNAFRVVSREVHGRVILLCDDVCTTGATLNICAELLLAAGASRVCAATLARDIQRPDKPDAPLPI